MATMGSTGEASNEIVLARFLKGLGLILPVSRSRIAIPFLPAVVTIRLESLAKRTLPYLVQLCVDFLVPAGSSQRVSSPASDPPETVANNLPSGEMAMSRRLSVDSSVVSALPELRLQSFSS